MQVRDFGKRSRTKYTHLLDQDTTLSNGVFDGAGPAKPNAGQGCFLCGGPHLKKGTQWIYVSYQDISTLLLSDCPQLQNQPGVPGSGANRTVFAGTAVPAERQWGKREEKESKSWKDRSQDDGYRGGDRDQRPRPSYRSERDQGADRKRDSYRRRSRSKSRSRSPDRRIRRRSRSRSVGLDSRDRDKRRRMD